MVVDLHCCYAYFVVLIGKFLVFEERGRIIQLTGRCYSTHHCRVEKPAVARGSEGVERETFALSLFVVHVCLLPKQMVIHTVQVASFWAFAYPTGTIDQTRKRNFDQQTTPYSTVRPAARQHKNAVLSASKGFQESQSAIGQQRGLSFRGQCCVIQIRAGCVYLQKFTNNLPFVFSKPFHGMKNETSSECDLGGRCLSSPTRFAILFLSHRCIFLHILDLSPAIC